MGCGQWYLNGSYLGPFVGLKEEFTEDLRYLGQISGVHIFENPKLPLGTAELWLYGRKTVVIEGLGKEK